MKMIMPKIVEAIENTTRDCDRQLNTLYTYFGKFLYENMEKENIFYCFYSENEHLEKDASELMRRIRQLALSEKNDTKVVCGFKKKDMEGVYVKLISKLRERENLLIPLKKNIKDISVCITSQVMPDYDKSGIEQETAAGQLRTIDLLISKLFEENSCELKSLERHSNISAPIDEGSHLSEITESFLEGINVDVESITHDSKRLEELTKEALENIKHDYEEDLGLVAP